MKVFVVASCVLGVSIKFISFRFILFLSAFVKLMVVGSGDPAAGVCIACSGRSAVFHWDSSPTYGGST